MNIPSIIESPKIESVEEQSPLVGLDVDGTLIGLIIIPIIIVAALIFLKRTDRLELITEKIPIGDLDFGDKIEGIKEKIADIKNR